jgi:hypothetical protein
MHEALPALVLNSEALPRTVMNETPTNQASAAENAGAASASAATDEQLMLAFSKGSSEAFTERALSVGLCGERLFLWKLEAVENLYTRMFRRFCNRSGRARR